MKKILICLAISGLVGQGLFAQTAKQLSEDEMARVRFAIHLVTYDTVGGFDNAVGEAYYKLILTSFEENFTIPTFTMSPMTGNDKAMVDKIVRQLIIVRDSPPTWDDLLIRETQYLVWQDKALSRTSRYKVNR